MAPVGLLPHSCGSLLHFALQGRREDNKRATTPTLELGDNVSLERQNDFFLLTGGTLSAKNAPHGKHSTVFRRFRKRPHSKPSFFLIWCSITRIFISTDIVFSSTAPPPCCQVTGCQSLPPSAPRASFPWSYNECSFCSTSRIISQPALLLVVKIMIYAQVGWDSEQQS